MTTEATPNENFRILYLQRFQITFYPLFFPSCLKVAFAFCLKNNPFIIFTYFLNI